MTEAHRELRDGEAVAYRRKTKDLFSTRAFQAGFDKAFSKEVLSTLSKEQLECSPMFRRMREALEYYDTEMCVFSGCGIRAKVTLAALKDMK